MDWIKDKLPKQYISVLATNGAEYFVAWITDENKWDSYDFTLSESSVEAWMPIPEY